MTTKLLLTFALTEARLNLLLQAAQRREELGQLEVAVLSNLAEESVNKTLILKKLHTSQYVSNQVIFNFLLIRIE